MSTHRCRRALAAGAAALLAVACASEEERLAAHLRRGEQHAAAGRLEEAVLEYRAALQLDEDSAGINFELAQLLEGLGRPGDAIFFYEEALRLDPSRLDAPLSEARLRMLENPERVETLVAQVLERDPNNLRAHLLASEFALAHGDLDAAERSVARAIEIDPEVSAVHDQTGVVHAARVRAQQLGLLPTDMSEHAAAVSAFERAIELAPPAARWRSRVKKALVLAAWDGHRAQALESFRLALAEAGEHAPAQVERVARTAAQYARMIQDPALQHAALRALADAGRATIPDWRSLARLEQNQGGSGDAVYAELLAQRPDDVDAHGARAFFWINEGRGAEAVAAIRELAARKGSEQPRALRLLVNVAHQAGAGSVREDAVRELLEAHPDSPHAVLVRAQRLLSRGERAEGAALLRELVDGKLVTAEVFYLLARVEFRLGNFAAARHAIGRAIELEPGFNLLHADLEARIERSLGDWKGVAAAIDRIVQNVGALQPEHRLLNIQALYASGREPLARKRLELLLKHPDAPPAAVFEWVRREGDRDPDGAREHLLALHARNPRDARALLLIVERLLDAGEVEEAAASVEKAWQDVGGVYAPGGYFVARARVRQVQGDLAGAEADLRALLSRAPGAERPLRMLVSVLAESGRLEEELAELEAAPVGTRADALLAPLFLEAGRTDEAKRRLEAALEHGHATIATRNDLAYLLARQGEDLDRALELAREAQAALPEDADVADTLALVYLRRGVPEAALEQVRYAIALTESGAPERPIYWYHLGLALHELGRADEAASALDRALAMGEFEESATARELRASLAAETS